MKNIDMMEREIHLLINQVSGPNFRGHELLAKVLLYQTEVLNRSLNDISSTIDSLGSSIEILSAEVAHLGNK